MAATALEIVRTAAAQQSQPQTEAETDNLKTLSSSKCSITLNAISVMLNLLSHQQKNPEIPLRRLSGWETDANDSKVLRAETHFLEKLKSTKSDDLSSDSFLRLLNPFLVEVQDIVGISSPPERRPSTLDLLKSLALYLPRDALNEIVRFSVALSFWKVVEVLLPCRVVNWNSSSSVVEKLRDAKRADVVCLFVENMPEIRPSDLALIINYFLDPSRDEGKMGVFRRERKKKTLAAIDKSCRKNPEEAGKFELGFQEMTRLLAAAFDGFSPAEFCMHSVVSSSIDENVLGFVIGQLDGKEVLKLIRYLEKWLRKYSGCHLTGPVDFPSVNGDLSYFRWVPSLASVLKWLNAILDEEYPNLVLRGEFHDLLKSVEERVRVLLGIVYEASSLSSIVELLKSDAKLANINSFKADEEHVVEHLDWNRTTFV